MEFISTSGIIDFCIESDVISIHEYFAIFKHVRNVTCIQIKHKRATFSTLRHGTFDFTTVRESSVTNNRKCSFT